jgi:hypothetical protein
MLAKTTSRVSLWLTLFCVSASLAVAADQARTANLLGNPSFESDADPWHASAGGTTDVTFTIDGAEAVDGKRSALLKIGTVESYGLQFGQSVGAPTVGKTYTFSALAKSMKNTVSLGLEIERPADPWDRAARLEAVKVGNAWQELHITFKVEKPFAEGWFAYVSCAQPNVEFRLDLCRLYEGEYVPTKLAAQAPAKAAPAKPSETPALPAPAKPAETASQPAADPSVKVFDTGSAAAAPLSGEAIQKQAGWKGVPEDITDHAFAGAAVLMNDRLAIVLRRGGPGAEV